MATTYFVSTEGKDYTTSNAAKAASVAHAWKRQGLSVSLYAGFDRIEMESAASDTAHALVDARRTAEVLAAIEAADLESPEQVADLVLEVARKRGDWRAKLAACAAIG